MYMTRMRLSRGAASQDDYWEAFESPYRIHQEIWKVFSDGPDRKRDFIYRMDFDRGCPVVHTVSTRPPRTQLPLWECTCKEYAPRLVQGMKLGFRLRVNPVRTRPHPQTGKPQRHDVVMDAKKRLRDAGDAPSDGPLPAEIVQAEGESWLRARSGKLGVDILGVVVDGYEVRRFGGGRVPGFHIATCDYSGTLAVADPEKLWSALMRGVGPAKGFGCGLLQVRRLR